MQRTPYIDGDYVVFPDGRRLLRVRGAEGDPPADPPKDPPKDDGKQFTQAELDRIVKDRLERQRQQFADYDDLKKDAQEMRAIREAGKDDLERVSGELDTTKSERDTAKAENLRLRVAIEKKLSPALIDRLQGDTKEALEADADQLLELVKPQEPGPDLDGGARKPPPPSDENISPGLGRLSHAYAQSDTK